MSAQVMSHPCIDLSWRISACCGISGLLLLLLRIPVDDNVGGGGGGEGLAGDVKGGMPVDDVDDACSWPSRGLFCSGVTSSSRTSTMYVPSERARRLMMGSGRLPYKGHIAETTTFACRRLEAKLCKERTDGGRRQKDPPRRAAFGEDKVVQEGAKEQFVLRSLLTLSPEYFDLMQQT